MTDTAALNTNNLHQDELLFLHAILDNARLIVNVTDRQHRLVMVNRYTETVTGFRPEELIGQPLLDTLVPPQDRTGLLNHFEQLWQGLPVESRDNYVLVKNGAPRLFSWTNSLVVDSTGQPKYIVGMGVDVTERRKAEEALRRAEAEKSLILDSTSEMFAYYDLDLRVLWANAASALSVGQPPQDLIGRHCYEIWQCRESPIEDCPVLRAGRTRQPESAEMATPDGRIFFVRGYPVIAENGEVTHLIEFGQDITERKKIDAQLHATLDEREVLLKEVHHRVKNNLEVIASLARLQSRQVSDPRALQNLRDLQERIYTIALVHEKLYHSENFSEIRASTFLPDLLDNLRQSIGLPGVQVQTDIDDIPLAMDAAIPLGLVVNELVSNAFKHAFNGVTEARLDQRIWVHFKQEADFNRLVVGDNGVGLPPALDWQTSPSLGFKLINRLSSQVHGQLSHSSQGGAVFELRFPAAAGA